MKRVFRMMALLFLMTISSCGQAAMQEATPIKATPIKATPIKATPTKATPTKATPIKATPTKATPTIEVAGDWKVRVGSGKVRLNDKIVALKTPQVLSVAPAAILDVKDESYDALELFRPNTAGWGNGTRLLGLRSPEFTAMYYLDTPSVVVKSAPDGEVFTRGTDYQVDEIWGVIGRLPDGKIGGNTKVFVSYKHGTGRLDSILADAHGKVFIRRGEAKIGLPEPPKIAEKEKRLANLWIFGRMTKLTDDNIFPITQSEYSQAEAPTQDIEKLLPKTLAKLRSGEPLKILAWGDSVTAGGYLPEGERWQHQFVARLRQRFPQAKIELLTEAWGGQTIPAYLSEPAGSEHNFREKVLAVRPDLIISEFVNDAYLTPQQVEEIYGGVLKDFNEIGAEWIIQTPHYVTPSWMGLTSEKNVDDDPRPYVAGLRTFAANHNVALSDASRHWGQLYKTGVPYSTLMINMINHPDARGMKLFADALMETFPQK